LNKIRIIKKTSRNYTKRKVTHAKIICLKHVIACSECLWIAQPYIIIVQIKIPFMFCLSKHLIHRLNIPIFGIHIHQGSPKSSSYLETIISNIFMHSQSSFKGINLFTSRKSRNDGENIQPYPFSNILKNMDNVFS